MIVLQTKIRPASNGNRGPGWTNRKRLSMLLLRQTFRAQYSGPVLTGHVVVSLWSPYFTAYPPVDSDNHLKVLFDSLAGAVYEDDSQIQEHHVYRAPDDWLVIEVAPFVAVGRECPKSTHGVWA